MKHVRVSRMNELFTLKYVYVWQWRTRDVEGHIKPAIGIRDKFEHKEFVVFVVVAALILRLPSSSSSSPYYIEKNKEYKILFKLLSNSKQSDNNQLIVVVFILLCVSYTTYDSLAYKGNTPCYYHTSIPIRIPRLKRLYSTWMAKSINNIVLKRESSRAWLQQPGID